MDKFVLSFAELKDETQHLAGGKGSSLAQLYQAGLPVPDGFVILPTGFVDDALSEPAWQQACDQLDDLRAGGAVNFAVRSSALSEDSVQASFAGEFETVLNVSSDSEIQAAIHTVYASRTGERVQAYSTAKGMADVHAVAVIIQELVPAERSGILFTANPITGARDEVIINAAWGLGEAIVGGLVSPDTLTVDKVSGELLQREIADKQIMTVQVASGTDERAVPEEKRLAPVLSQENVSQLVTLGNTIEELYGMPMDIEWTLTKDVISIVQARPITALPAPMPAVPTDWPLPPGAYIAMRNNIVELMADPLTPLFRTLGLAAVNTSLNHLMTGFFGREGVLPETPIIAVNQYAYYNGSLKFGEMLKMLFSARSIYRRMFTGAVARWTEEGRPRYIATVTEWQALAWQELSTTELLQAVQLLTAAAIDAYGAMVSGVIPGAWISEALFTFTYKLVKRRDDPPAPTYLMGFDSFPIRAEKALYELAQWVQQSPALKQYIADTPTMRIAAQSTHISPTAELDSAAWQAWQERFQTYLNTYGHTVYNLDFGSPVPADDPSPLVETLKVYVRGQGTDPYRRQQEATQRRQQATAAMKNRLKGFRLRLFTKYLQRAQRFAPLREDSLADVGLSYPLVRQMLREIGRRLASGNMLAEEDDIFWLEQQEVMSAAQGIESDDPLPDMRQVVQQRRASWKAMRRSTPPMMLPQIKIFGRDIAATKAERASKKEGNTLKGVAASPGSVTATASVLHSPEDFAIMQTGNVLVAPLTTPAWTPLFARASAVVTDIGGPLSHGSIVAREYGIPAVLGTNAATKRIRSGQAITVDGDAGKVIIIENGHA